MRIKAVVWVWLLAFFAVPLLTSCYVEEHPRPYPYGPTGYATYEYEYYPDAEVYYLPARHVYYWQVGGEWRSGPRVPEGYVLHSHVRVDLDSPEPWRHHDEVKSKYPRHTKEEGREHHEH